MALTEPDSFLGYGDKKPTSLNVVNVSQLSTQKTGRQTDKQTRNPLPRNRACLGEQAVDGTSGQEVVCPLL